ncbi:hypothetical protein COBT_003385 [Conglomerata obtusa]
MGLKCDICHTPYSLHDGVYICEDGHIYQHNEEVCDTYVGFTGRAKKLEKSTQTHQESLYYKLLKTFTQLYIEMKRCIGIKEDLTFKIFLSYIRYENNKVNDYFTFHFLFSILYYQKRIECESEGNALLYSDFEKMFDVSLYNYKLHTISKEQKFEKLQITQALKFHYLEVKMFNCVQYLEFLGEQGYKERRFCYFIKEKDYDHKNKRLMRMAVRKDQEMMDLYLKNICEILFLEISDDLQKSFTKSCNFYCTDERVFIPDLFIYAFLFLYVRNKKIDLNYELIESERCYIEDYNDGYEREMNEYKEIITDKENYIRGLNNRAIIVENKILFSEYSSVKRRLRKIFCFLMKISGNKFRMLIRYYRLFMDCCKEKHLYEKFMQYDKLYGIKKTLVRVVRRELSEYERREAKNMKKYAKYTQ